MDWLRVAAFALLIAYHCAVAFFPNTHWLVHSPRTSAGLESLMDHSRAWRLALLFFVSGMGVHFASARQSVRAFLFDRAKRLGLPLLTGMAIVVVPQVWCERVMDEGYRGSLLDFWLTRYFLEGRYPTGQFTWAHLWFVAYLLVATTLMLPLLRHLERQSAMAVRIEALIRSPLLGLLFLVPLGLNLLLTPLFPRQTNALYNDGAWFAVWTAWFCLGFFAARHIEASVEVAIGRRWWSAAAACVLTAILYGVSFGTAGPLAAVGAYNEMTPLFKLLTFALAWAMILALTGFAALHLDRRSGVVAWLNDGILPLYLIHQTVTVVALWQILPLGFSALSSFALVLAATLLFSFAFLLCVRRLPAGLALAFGYVARPRQRNAATDDVPGQKPQNEGRIAA